MKDNQFEAGQALWWDRFGQGRELVLATSAKEDVTARTVSVGVEQGILYFATFADSVKCGQIRQNPQVALCAEDLCLKGQSRILGDAQSPEGARAMQAIAKTFPEEIGQFSQLPGCVFLEIIPVRCSFTHQGHLYALDFAAKTVDKRAMD